MAPTRAPHAPRRRLVDIGACAFGIFFPLSLILVLFPIRLYLHNKVELFGSLPLLYPLFWVGAGLAVASAVLATVLLRHRPRFVWDLAGLGLALGFYGVLGDLVAPISVDATIGFSGTERILRPPSMEMLLDVAVLAAVTIGFRWLRKPDIIRAGAAAALAILVAGIVPVFWVETQKAVAGDEEWIIENAPPRNYADHPNVYHLIFDGFQSGALKKAMQQAGLTDSDFDGFIYYPKNRSNYQVTEISLASFMTGTTFRGGAILGWFRKWYSDNVWTNLRSERGTYPRLYTLWSLYNNVDFDARRRIDESGQLADIAFHMALARAAPAALHEYLFKDGRGQFSSIFRRSEGIASLDIRLRPIIQMTDDEANRPSHGQYVYAHLMIPHLPFAADEDCLFRRDHPFKEESYNAQAICAVRQATMFLDALRRAGRYKDSIVIIQADHGFPFGEALGPFTGSNDESIIHEEDLRGRFRKWTALEHDQTTRALLMIKPPGSAGTPMRTSDLDTQLLDLPNTVYDLLGAKTRTPEGKSVFDEDYPRGRPRHVYSGFLQWDRRTGRPLWFGQDFMETRFNHYAWTDGVGWRNLPKVDARWK